MRKTLKLVFVSMMLIFLASCKKDEIKDSRNDFGTAGTHEVETYTESDYAFSTIYYPKDIATMPEKSPLIFFASGWFNEAQTSSTYESLLNFLTSRGYTVVYTYEGGKTNAQYSIEGYEKILNTDFVKNNISQYLDTKKIGVVGHSAGGGIAFKILDYYSKEKSYGTEARFLMGLDPWFAFEMDEAAMKNLPSNTNVVIIKFGEGGNNLADGTDARIPLTEYYLLESIADSQKDYQIYKDADHSYPKGNGSFSEMQGILQPLDALMEYTFVDQSEEVRKIALENGNDDPYANGNGIQVVYEKSDYKYPCDGANTLIDYCSIAQ